MQTIKLLVVDDHPTFRNGLCRMLDEEEDIDCIGEAKDGFEAISMARKINPDVVLMDIKLPGLSGTQAAREIRKQCPNTAIIMLSAFDYDAFILTSLQAGVRGYILKTSPLEKIKNAIRLVHNGGSIIDVKAIDKLQHHLRQREGDRDRSPSMSLEILSPRELEVIELAARGMNNKRIASELFLSERTIQTHLVNIFRKLKTNSRTQALLYALKEGWIVLEGAREDINQPAR